MLTTVLLAATFAAAVLDWIAVWRSWRGVEYAAKPATMILLFAWMYVQADLSGPMFWFGIGLLMSLLGDIFLMLPSDRFVLGLAAFLMAQVAYILAFLSPIPKLTWPMLGAFVVVAVLAFQLIRRIEAGVRAKKLDKLVTPVRIYANALTLMWLCALLTLFRPDWETTPALLASAGGTLFFVSDAILAWNRFVAPLKWGRIVNMATYHLGQVGLIAGALYQFAK